MYILIIKLTTTEISWKQELKSSEWTTSDFPVDTNGYPATLSYP